LSVQAPPPWRTIIFHDRSYPPVLQAINIALTKTSRNPKKTLGTLRSRLRCLSEMVGRRGEAYEIISKPDLALE